MKKNTLVISTSVREKKCLLFQKISKIGLLLDFESVTFYRSQGFFLETGKIINFSVLNHCIDRIETSQFTAVLVEKFSSKRGHIYLWILNCTSYYSNKSSPPVFSLNCIIKLLDNKKKSQILKLIKIYHYLSCFLFQLRHR